MCEGIHTWTTTNIEIKQCWGSGPWVDEPDVAIWRDGVTNFICLAERNTEIGTWCGYVAVDPRHPLHELVHYDDDGGLDIRLAVLNVHREVTFTGPTVAFARLPAAAFQELPHDAWWLGFHCAYEGTSDFAPGRRMQLFVLGVPDGLGSFLAESDKRVYRKLEYVIKECGRLAEQLASLSD